MFNLPSLDPRLLDLQTWPQVDEQAIPGAEKQSLFVRRSKAIRLLLAKASANQISASSEVTRREAMRLLQCCLMVHPDGRILGFRGLIPYHRIASYTRRALPPLTSNEQKAGAAGCFEQLLLAHPVLANLIEDHIFHLSLVTHVQKLLKS